MVIEKLIASVDDELQEALDIARESEKPLIILYYTVSRQFWLSPLPLLACTVLLIFFSIIFIRNEIGKCFNGARKFIIVPGQCLLGIRAAAPPRFSRLPVLQNFKAIVRKTVKERWRERIILKGYVGRHGNCEKFYHKCCWFLLCFYLFIFCWYFSALIMFFFRGQ